MTSDRFCTYPAIWPCFTLRPKLCTRFLTRYGYAVKRLWHDVTSNCLFVCYGCIVANGKLAHISETVRDTA